MYTNIAGREAKPPKAPKFIFPLKDKVFPENLLIDKRSKIDKFKSILATSQQIYPYETYEDICATCQIYCAISDLDHKTNTPICFHLYKKLIKHYRTTNRLSYGETNQINRILQDINVITDNIGTCKQNEQKIQNNQNNSKQRLDYYPVLHTQSQKPIFEAKNLPYIQVMINNKLTHFVIDTGASRSICLAQHAQDIEQIETKKSYDPVSISGLMSTSTKCIQYTANFPIQFQGYTSKWKLVAWVASNEINFKYNLLGSDFLEKYNAVIQMGSKLLTLYNKDKEVEIPFVYVKTFPRNIYQLDNNPKVKHKILEENEKPKKPKINLDRCIEFQPNALDYFTEKDIDEIKQTINSENEEQPLAIHEQYKEKDTDSNNDINVILQNYIEQDSNQTIDFDPVQTNLDKVTILQETDLKTPFMTPDLAHLTPHVAEGICTVIKEHLQALTKNEADIGEFKLFHVKIDVQEGMTSLQKCRSTKLHQIEPYMNNLIKAQVFKEKNEQQSRQISNQKLRI